MKPLLVAWVAIGISWPIDIEFNNGRYTAFVKDALRATLLCKQARTRIFTRACRRTAKDRKS
jgi:hypothetical protein